LARILLASASSPRKREESCQFSVVSLEFRKMQAGSGRQ
jgi:hypothetical protein